MGDGRGNYGSWGSFGQIAGLLLLGALCLLLATGASAHAELRESFPAPGQSFRWERPDEVRLSVTQPLAPEGNRVVVTDEGFRAVVTGEATLDPADPFTVRAALPPLREGRYTVTWHTESVDGHGFDGSYEFAILPWQPLVTSTIAVVVFSGMALLVFLRRAGPEDEVAG